MSEELSEEDNLWLNRLRADLSTTQLERFSEAKEPKVPMDAYFQVIGAANIEAMEELYMRRKSGVILSEKLDAFFTEKYGAPWIAEGEARNEAKWKSVASMSSGVKLEPPLGYSAFAGTPRGASMSFPNKSIETVSLSNRGFHREAFLPLHRRYVDTNRWASLRYRQSDLGPAGCR